MKEHQPNIIKETFNDMVRSGHTHRMFIAGGIAIGFAAASPVFPSAIAGACVAGVETGRQWYLLVREETKPSLKK